MPDPEEVLSSVVLTPPPDLGRCSECLAKLESGDIITITGFYTIRDEIVLIEGRRFYSSRRVPRFIHTSHT